MSIFSKQFWANELLEEIELQRLIKRAKQLKSPGNQTWDTTGKEIEWQKSGFGEYELLEEIGRGGMGVVYKAQHRKLGRICALKMIRSGQLASREEVERFYNEAESAACLDHPGIVPVYDIGHVDGYHFYSMGFVEGVSLANELQDGPLHPKRAAELTQQIAEAIAYAHDRNVIHRDLKPANVMLDSNGQPRVTDFGLAKKTKGKCNLTATGQIFGTPSFMAPEQAAGKLEEINERADVYSLGTLLYTLLTGRPPFQTASPMDTLMQVLNKEPLSPSKLVPNIPRDLETICLKCLHKDPMRRYAEAGELFGDLKRWQNHQPILARRISAFERAMLWCKRNPMMVATAWLLIFAGIIGAAALYESNASQLCASALKADVENLTEISDSLTFYSIRADNKLFPVALNGKSPKEKLHAQIVLLKRHPEFAESLKDALIDESLEYEYIQVNGDALKCANIEFTDDLWAEFRDKTQSDSKRFRAGLVLSNYAGGVEEWNDFDATFLVRQFLKVSPEFYATTRQYLYPNRTNIRKQLSTAFFDGKSTRGQQLAVAKTVIEFYPTDYDYLLPMLLLGSADQYNELFPLFEKTSEFNNVFLDKIKQRPGEKVNVPDRVRLGRERASAAITLLRKGLRDSILEVMRYESDPEALTQFVHRCKDCGVALSDLRYLFQKVDQRRRSVDGERQKLDDSVMYALLLAMGEYRFEQVPEPRETLVSRLAEIYAKDPSSGVHSATGWLLRKWGQHEKVERVDTTPLAFDKSGHREWYVEEMNLASDIESTNNEKKKLYFTFIVFPTGEFQLGSTEDEPGHLPNERARKVKLTRAFAVCDCEVTWQQWTAIEGAEMHDSFSRRFYRTPSTNEPVYGMTWFQAANFCYRLTAKSGMTAEEQSFADPQTLEKDKSGNPIQWPVELDKPGFRLPTEAESEYVARSGTSTAYSFGSDVTWLGKYAWYKDNSQERAHRVGQLSPNPRGLFDVHGNLCEWCYDWYGTKSAESTIDPTGAKASALRVMRPGSFEARVVDCRSARRGQAAPWSRGTHSGFRIFRGNLDFDAVVDSDFNEPKNRSR